MDRVGNNNILSQFDSSVQDSNSHSLLSSLGDRVAQTLQVQSSPSNESGAQGIPGIAPSQVAKAFNQIVPGMNHSILA